ncbi:hypothetical protein ACFVJ4_37530 [Streptomyces sp. NPDC127178]|uniref:hypothetical protein n=1 Tax=unclassified Streptomyces TaxID=2593676 RepID=UPI00362B7431
MDTNEIFAGYDIYVQSTEVVSDPQTTSAGACSWITWGGPQCRHEAAPAPGPESDLPSRT